MNGYPFNIFALFLFVFPIEIANAQWMQLNRPPGGEIEAFAETGNTIFVGTWGSGIFRSTDNGTNWEVCNSGIGANDKTIRYISVIGSKIFAVGDNEVYLSTDNGTNWNTFFSQSSFSISAFTVKDSTTYFVGGSPGIISYSTDNGASWWNSNSGLSNLHYATAIVICGDTIIAGLDHSGIYMSTDNGATWKQPVTTGLPTNSYIFFFLKTDSCIYANTVGGLYSSDDNGFHWKSVQTGNLPIVRSLAYSNNKTLFAGSDSGVFFSTDKGTSWIAASPFPYSSIFSFNRVDAIAMTDSIVFAGTQGGGVFLSSDSGTSWSNTGFGFSAQAVSSLTTIGDILFLGTYAYGIFRSIDNGLHWTSIDSGLPRCRVCSMKAIGTTVLAGISYFNDSVGGVFISNDSGKTWFPPYSSIPHKPVWAFVESGNTIFIGTDNGVFTSNDTGKTWSVSGLVTNAQFSNIQIHALLTKGDTVFAANQNYSNHEDSVIFRSTDKGMTWAPLHSGFTDCTVAHSLATIGSTIFAGTGCAPGTPNNGVFRSIDNGDTWTAVGLQNSIIHDFAVSDGNLFVATDSGVYVSGDLGNSWTSVDSGLTDIVSSFLVRYNDLYAVTDITSSNGIWRRPISEMTAVKSVSKQRTQEQSGEITVTSRRSGSCIAIELTLFSSSKIVANIVDVSGHIVVRLVDTNLCPGQYRYQWNAGNVANGCYFVHMQSKSGTDVRRILILR
jgi:photosystem II stability/assembly factor-like uncharacterized protein